jgi:hypothetical protein
MGRTRDKFIGGLHLSLGVVLLGGVLLLYGLHSKSGPMASNIGLDKSKQVGLWEWRSIPEIGNYSAKLKKVKADGINKIYLNVNDVVDINETQPANLSGYIGRIQSYTKAASSYGISVDALAGAKDWATPQKQYLMQQVADFVSSYNVQSQPASQLSGLQFDVEAYNQPAYIQNQQQVMSDYLNAVYDVSGKWNSNPNTKNLELGFTVPLWLDGDNNYAKKVSWGGKNNYPSFLLTWELSKLKNPYIIVMDYRNKAEGPNGSIAHANGEINYAQKYYSNVKIVVGQEVSYVEPTSITFYGKDRDYIAQQIGLLNKAFANKPVFNGIAFNDFKNYEKLL